VSAIALGSPFRVVTYSDENHTMAASVSPVFTHSLGLYLYTTPDKLGHSILVDYVARKRK